MLPNDRVARRYLQVDGVGCLAPTLACNITGNCGLPGAPVEIEQMELVAWQDDRCEVSFGSYFLYPP